MRPRPRFLLAPLLLAGCCALLLSCSDSEEPPEGGHPESTTLPADITPPADAMPLAGVRAISAGAYHNCALTEEGRGLCWGGNESGQLGDGTLADRPFAAGVAGLEEDVAKIAAGFRSTCAITSQGALLCWGNNTEGLAGDGTTETRTRPVAVVGLDRDVADVAVGREHACALATGKVWCWGDNAFGQLGDGTTEQQQTTPVEVLGVAGDAVSIGLGWYHSCVLTASGQVMCWGNNQTAQLATGAGATSQSNKPITTEGLPSGIISLAVGGGHNCVLTGAGAVVCWGANNYGQTGDGTTADRVTPIEVEGLGGEAEAINAGTGQSCALLRSGAVRCWGHDWYGELGDGTEGEGNVQPEPVELRGAGNAATLAMGRFHTCVLTDDGSVQCVGRNGYGELGDGTRMQRLAPVRVVG